MPSQSARGIALAALTEWRRSTRFADAIVQQLLAQSVLIGSDRSFATELFYGVLRNLTLLDFWIARLRSGALDRDARDLLRLGLYQIFCLRTPGHAAVYETVQLAPVRKRPLINAVLRGAIRRANELIASADAESLAVRYSHPEFLLRRWTTAFGAEATAKLCEWNNTAAPIYARVNLLKIDPHDFVAARPAAEALAERPNFFRLATLPAEALQRGECYIQDPSASVACELLAPKPGETVLDACAAPGGKSAYLAELMENSGQLIACDREAARLNLLRENIARLGITNTRVVRQDWTSPQLTPELEGLACDRILLDAPCTNTGVMRRRVDLRWRLKPEDFTRMPNEQLAILRALLPLLKPGGTLVYSTCSIEAEENEMVVDHVLREFPALALAEQKSVLPFRDQFDGAFAAKLTKTS